MLTLPAAAQDSLPQPPRDSAFGPIGTLGDTVRPQVERDSLGRPIIKYIEIHRSDIFDTTEAHSFIAKLMNGLHFMTAPSVVSREILFKVGEPYDSSDVAETARNLRTVAVFRKVRIDSVTTDTGFTVKVFTQDGWSTQADLRFRSAGNQTDWQVALIEKNLIGTATRFAIRYRHTPDRNQLGFQFLQPRLFRRTVLLGLRYETRSDGKRGSVAIERPFFSLRDKAGISTLLDVRNERMLRFREGFADASDSLRRKFLLGRVEVAKAIHRSNRGYLRVGFNAQVRRDDFGPWPQKNLEQSVTGAFGPFIEWRRANFIVMRGFTKIGQDEDVDVSNFARLGLTLAPDFLGYDSSGVGLLGQVRFGTRLFHGGFAWVDARANGLYTAGGLDSGSVTLGGTAVVMPARKHLLISHADIGWIKNPLPGYEFDLGFSQGPRGFPIHAFTGDRTYFATAEYRYIFGQDVFKAIDLGVAGFVDHGGAWYNGSARRTGTNLGFGLRLGPSRAADSNPTRLDLAYRFKNDRQKAGWVFVVASGLVFSTQPRGQ
ncbi:MAG TPA: hypothetical protein VG692_04380 [Gemmatimonadales bacterium]|nr:hypothetical protein [Gemmatimonadales bacterium]